MTMATSHLVTSILPRQQAMTVTPDFGDIKDNGEKCNATQREKERERERERERDFCSSRSILVCT